MVKKIRLVEDDTNTENKVQNDFQVKMLDYLQAIDWKLWEMLKIEQLRAAKEGLIPESKETLKKKARQPSANVKPIIVDEEK